jgi:hypothetical protein
MTLKARVHCVKPSVGAKSRQSLFLRGGVNTLGFLTAPGETVAKEFWDFVPAGRSGPGLGSLVGPLLGIEISRERMCAKTFSHGWIQLPAELLLSTRSGFVRGKESALFGQVFVWTKIPSSLDGHIGRWLQRVRLSSGKHPDWPEDHSFGVFSP